MKIFLVTMKSIGDYWVGERLKAIALEAAATEENPAPARQNHIKAEDDVRDITLWRERIANRKALLDRIGITIQERESGGDDVPEYKRNEHIFNPTFACTGDQLLEIMAVDDSVTVKSSAPVASDSIPGMIERMEYIVKRFESIELPAINGGETIYNQKCEVHMPGQALASYNETLLLEDSCTDRLQEALNVGWRVIAACPQPDNRRPDYIMGRFNPSIESAPDGARRSA